MTFFFAFQFLRGGGGGRQAPCPPPPTRAWLVSLLLRFIFSDSLKISFKYSSFLHPLNLSAVLTILTILAVVDFICIDGISVPTMSANILHGTSYPMLRLRYCFISSNTNPFVMCSKFDLILFNSNVTAFHPLHTVLLRNNIVCKANVVIAKAQCLYISIIHIYLLFLHM